MVLRVADNSGSSIRSQVMMNQTFSALFVTINRSRPAIRGIDKRYATTEDQFPTSHYLGRAMSLRRVGDDTSSDTRSVRVFREHRCEHAGDDVPKTMQRPRRTNAAEVNADALVGQSNPFPQRPQPRIAPKRSEFGISKSTAKPDGPQRNRPL